MPEILASPLLAEGMLSDARNTYLDIRNRQASEPLSRVMDLGSVNVTNRTATFGYLNAAPHFDIWARGENIPEGAMDSVNFPGSVYEFGRLIRWSTFDRKDDQTQSLIEGAQAVGRSAALTPERNFFNLLEGTTTHLPAVPLAPDGAAMHAATDGGGAARFGVTGGNIFGGGGVATVSALLSDYYTAIERFMSFQDGKGQPLLEKSIIDQGVTIIHPAIDTEIFETAFLQQRQGVLMAADAAATPSNIVKDSNRKVELWGTSRLTTTAQWYIFLNGAPKMATFRINREGLVESQALEGDNNSDENRRRGTEYVAWYAREGAGINLPYQTIEVTAP